MANNRDVQLVIRAKNDASKAIDAVTSALKSLTEGQKSFGQTAKTTDSVLNKLGAELTKIASVAAGANVFDKMAASVNKAAEAVGRLETQVSDAAREQARLSAEVKTAAANTEKLKAEAAAAASNVKAQKDALKAQQQAYSGLTSEISKASVEKSKLETRERALTSQIETQTKRVSDAIAKQRQLQAEMAATTDPSKGLTTRSASADASARSQVSKLFGMMTEQREAVAAIQALDAQIGSLRPKVDAASTALERQKAAVTQASAATKPYTVAVRDAEKAQKNLQSAASIADSTLEAQQTSLAAARTEMEALTSAVKQGDAAYQKIAATTRLNLLRSLQDAKASLSEFKSQWLAAQTNVKSLGGATAYGPNMQGVDQSVAAAQTAKRAYQEQAAAVAQLQRSLREAGTNLNALTITQAKFAAESGNSAARAERVRAAMAGMAAAANQAIPAISRLPVEIAKTGNETRRVTQTQDGFFASMVKFNREARQSMSLWQRLRGEVAAYGAAIIGLQGTINAFRSVADAAIDVQVAESRLNVVAKGDSEKTAQEFAWVREEAERLGFDIRVLTKEWSTFAVAAQGTNITAAETRKIFKSVAETGRTLNLSSEGISRSYVALTQMLSKGSIQMEELRQQLGEHIPGAFAIMAEAVDMTQVELMKLMEAGGFDASNLVAFADRLTERFGDQLPKALTGLRPEIERFKTNWTLALREVGETGVVEKMTAALRDLNASLKDGGADKALLSLAKAMTGIISLARALAENIELVTFALSSWVSFKLAGTVMGWVVMLSRWNLALQASIASMTRFTAAAGVMGAASRALGAAMAFLMGPWGMLIAMVASVAAAGAFTRWATTVDDASEAIKRHKTAVDDLRTAYALAEGDIDKIDKKFKDRAALKAAEDLKSAKQAMADYKKQLLDTATVSVPDTLLSNPQYAEKYGKYNEQIKQIDSLRRAFSSGELSAIDFQKALAKIGDDAANKDVADLVKAFVAIASKADEAEDAIRDNQFILDVLNKTVDQAALTQNKFTGALDDTEDGLKGAESAAKKYADALLKLRQLGSGTEGVEAKRDKDLASAKSQYDQLARQLEKRKDLSGEAMATEVARLKSEYDKVVGAINSKFATDYAKQLPVDFKQIVDRIIYAESGGDPLAKNKASTASGVGQFTDSTWISTWNQMMPDLADMSDEMKLAFKTNREMGEKFTTFLTQQNATRLTSSGVTPSAENLYLAHFLGPEGAIKVTLANPDEIVSNLVSKQAVAANSSVLGNGQTASGLVSWARGKMGGGAPITSGGATTEEVYRADFSQRMSAIADETAARDKESTREYTIQKAIQDEILRARKEGVTLNDVDFEIVRDTVGAQWDGANAEKEKTKAVEEVNGLYQLRQALLENIDLAFGKGNDTEAEQLTKALDDVNSRLDRAIPKARALAESFGDEAALARLENIELQLIKNNERVITGKQVNDAFSSAGMTAFDSVAKAIANGATNIQSWKQSLKDVGNAFRQFFADILMNIAKIIAQTAILNALGVNSSGGGGFGGIIAGLLGSLFSSYAFGGSSSMMTSAVFDNGADLAASVNHGGGLAGMGSSRNVAASWFANAERFHGGGLPGLRADEVPSILQKGEEVLAKDSPRNILNGGASGNMKIINAIDSPSFLSEALGSATGERVFLNHVRANSAAVKRALGI